MNEPLGMTPLHGAPLEVAKQLAYDAGLLVKRMGEEGVERREKADRSVVTEADLAADRLIHDGLLEAFPDAAILSEEIGGVALKGADLVWVVDPLDGTRAFAAGRPGWSVMIGILRDGEPALGVVYDPITDRLFWAVRGHGAWVREGLHGEPRQVRMSRRSEPQEMRLVTTPSFSADKRASLIDRVGFVPGEVINSVGIKVGLLALQEGDVYFSHHGLGYWDTVAPITIAREAGGDVSLLDGTRFVYDPAGPPDSLRHVDPMLVTNGVCHDAVRRLVADALDD